MMYLSVKFLGHPLLLYHVTLLRGENDPARQLDSLYGADPAFYIDKELLLTAGLEPGVSHTFQFLGYTSHSHHRTAWVLSEESV